MLPKNIQSGYFSGGQGLFDDNSEDELFWGQPNKPEEINNKLVEETKTHHSSKVLKGSNKHKSTVLIYTDCRAIVRCIGYLTNSQCESRYSDNKLIFICYFSVLLQVLVNYLDPICNHT